MPSVRRFAVVYLTAQGLAALLWWAVLAAFPAARAHFKPAGAPDSTLFAFAVADILLFAVGSLAAAVGLHQNTPWAWPVLVAHAGAAAYAGLYCVTLPAVAGGSGWLAAVGMAPAVVVPPALAWQMRPRREPAA